MPPLDTAPPADSTDSQTPERAAKTIFRNVAKGMNYTQIPNDLLCDTRLDLDERGALSMILSFPTDWDFSEEQFRQKNGIGHNRVSRIIRSLEKYGYCKRVRERNGKQQWVGRRVYWFTNVPGGFPDADDAAPTDNGPTDPKPSNGDPHTQNPQMGSAPVASAPVGIGTRQNKERDKGHIETNPPSEGERALPRAAPPQVKPDPDVRVIDAEAVEVEQAENKPTRHSPPKPPKKAGRLPKQLQLMDTPQRPQPQPHMNGVGYVISEAMGLIIPTSTIDRWRETYPEIDLEPKLGKLSSYILAGPKRHPGRVAPEQWIEGCLSEDKQKLAKGGRGRGAGGPGVQFEAMRINEAMTAKNGGW
jgi:hypothetical protein